ncbi:UDP-forming cellulose synthase catalytic subunit [Candidatus Methylobacter oryzae]|uniref:Cellulose synthase catalytic subunit [UDP-forming] n=1 Tax=Candidatus Methylobacter oryzae TaxID=2497749 RepID=A0ABY3CHC1_9GAMM|nr:UDP-forming cellulose synthase catalytic subunit [Candidatus Methylobacter oryzae]TRX03603.1 UDP-forming cellulose synthase catalytic subunit [Candidatus Methylobacter oryzae]
MNYRFDDKIGRRLLNAALFLCVLLFIYMANLTLDVSEQFMLGWGGVFILVVAKRRSFFQKPLGRILFLVIVAFISLRYFLWRTFDTLIYTGPMDCVMMSLVYLAELQVSLVHYINLFVNLWPLKRRIAPLPKNQSLWPTVDIFIPTYTEDVEITHVTATAATLLDYPKDKLNVYILDDGSSEQRRNNPILASAAWQRYNEMQEMSARLGVGYLTREKNEHAKAGNLNEALKKTSGDLILILDCDHIPSQDFLQKTVGWFLKDKKLFLVQTPHFFINPDPLEKRMGSFGDAPGEHEMFYRAGHPAMDLWNASFFCGSAAILRRKFLDEVGGIAGDTITEDAETALGLHGKGYNSAFIDRPMVCGLSPETLEDFLVQRTRWCQGMLQIGFLKNPMGISGLSMPQRLCYSSTYLFWFFGFARFLFFIAPTLFILFGLQIYHASAGQILAYAMPNLITSFIASDYLFGKYRWPMYSECYEGLQSIFLLPAVLGVICNPRKPTFKVTPKGKNQTQDMLSPLAGPYYLMVVIMLVSVPVAVYEWITYPIYRDVILICASWVLYNLAISFASLGIFWERSQIRRHHRFPVKGKITAFLEHDKKIIIDGEMMDLSLSGIGFKFPISDALKQGDIVILKTNDSRGDVHELSAKIMFLANRKGFAICGCEFTELEQRFADVVKMVYGDSQRWVDFWEHGGTQRPSALYMMYQFIFMAGKGAKFGIIGMWRFGRESLKSAWTATAVS